MSELTVGRIAFTPGDWKWFNYPDGRKLLSGRDRAVIHCPDAPIGITEADQALIAAAPDLFAIVLVIDGDVKLGEPCPLCSEAPHRSDCSLVKAITKAEGR